MGTVIIDIGTHKCEELNVLICPSISELAGLLRASAKKLLGRSNLSLSSLSVCWGIFFTKPLQEELNNLKIIALEPNLDVCIKKINRLKKITQVIHFPIVVQGHDFDESTDIVALNMYDDSLSSSIYNKKNINKIEQLNCLGVDFYNFYKLLLAKNILTLDDKVVVRMNCEGAEFGVVIGIRNLISDGVQIEAVIGSLADVKKIHGEEKYDEMIHILQSCGLEYKYFKGTDLESWSVGLSEIKRVISGYNR